MIVFFQQYGNDLFPTEANASADNVVELELQLLEEIEDTFSKSRVKT